MKKQHLFTLDIEVIKKLHQEVARGFRSQFVNKAIKKRLEKVGHSLEDEETIDLLCELRYRRDLPEWFMNQLVLVYKELNE